MTLPVFLTAIISAMLVNNIILSQFLGICPFLGVSKKMESSMGMSAAVAFVMLLASIVTWPLYHYVLIPNEIAFMSTITFILVIASLVQLVEMFLKKYSTSLYKSLGVYLPLITTNCAILGVAFLNIQEGYNFISSLVGGVSAGIGFALALIMMSGVR